MPVIVNVYTPAVVELQETVAVPEFVRPVGLILAQLKLACGESARLTVPVNPFTAVTVIVEVAEALTLAEGDVAIMVKSVTVNVAVLERVRSPLVAVTVTA